MKIMVTGAGGLIGGHTLRVLQDAGYALCGLYRQAPPAHAVPWEILSADLLEGSSWEEIGRRRADVLVHCAAALPQSLADQGEDPAGALNRAIDDRIIDICRQAGMRLIYISTGSVYGFRGAPWEEDSPLHPTGIYVREKIVSETKILEELRLPVILRINAPYGPGQRTRPVLRHFIDLALDDRPLTYHGSGKREQDFIHAEDAARAVLCAVRNSGIAGVINIASGRSISMRDLARLVIERVPGCRSSAVSSGRHDPQEDFRPAFSIEKARQALGWNPSVSLETGIRRWAEILGRQK